MTVIGSNAFEYCSRLDEMIFGGTKREWLAVAKNKDWDKDTDEFTVICTDGKVLQ